MAPLNLFLRWNDFWLLFPLHKKVFFLYPTKLGDSALKKTHKNIDTKLHLH